MSAKEVIRYSGLVVLSILLILSLITALTTTSARIYLSPEVYKETFAKNQVYESLAKSLSKEDVSQFLPKEELEKQGNQLIENLLSYMLSEKEQLDLTITLDNVLIKKALEQKIAAAPTCAAGQQSIEDEKIACRPASISSEELLSQVLAKRGISLDKPITRDLKPLIDKDNNIATFKEYVSVYKTTRLFSWILAVVALIAIFFVASGNASRMRWMGLPLFIVGIACFLLQGIFGAAILDTVSGPNVSSLFQSVISDLIAPFTSSLTVYSVITGLLGLVFFGCSFFFRTAASTTDAKKKDKK